MRCLCNNQTIKSLVPTDFSFTNSKVECDVQCKKLTLKNCTLEKRIMTTDVNAKHTTIIGSIKTDTMKVSNCGLPYEIHAKDCKISKCRTLYKSGTSVYSTNSKITNTSGIVKILGETTDINNLTDAQIVDIKKNAIIRNATLLNMKLGSGIISDVQCEYIHYTLSSHLTLERTSVGKLLIVNSIPAGELGPDICIQLLNTDILEIVYESIDPNNKLVIEYDEFCEFSSTIGNVEYRLLKEKKFGLKKRRLAGAI